MRPPFGRVGDLQGRGVDPTFEAPFAQNRDAVARAVERLRIEAAGRMLAESRQPLKLISRRCGFGSEETMRRSFQRVLAITPS